MSLFCSSANCTASVQLHLDQFIYHLPGGAIVNELHLVVLQAGCQLLLRKRWPAISSQVRP